MELFTLILAISLFIVCVAAPFSRALNAYRQDLEQVVEERPPAVQVAAVAVRSLWNGGHTENSTTTGIPRSVNPARQPSLIPSRYCGLMAGADHIKAAVACARRWRQESSVPATVWSHLRARNEMKTFVQILAVSLVFTLGTTTLSQATQVIHRSVEQLGQQSSLVVRGKVAGVRSFWNDKHTKIFTETEITVDQSYKGGQPSAIRILQLGGIVDNVKVNVAGALQWRTDEEVLVFLEPYTNGTFQVSGFSQGRFNIVRDPRTNQMYIERPSQDGVEFVGGATPDELRRASRVEKMPLERFINQALGRK
jgi:hypothetical protein